MQRICLGVVVLLALFHTLPARADAPKVVKATPDNGDTDVDPRTREIRVEFDQPMDQTGRSIVGGGETFPKIIGKPRWVNAKTIVMTVKLEPEHEYWLSINNETFKNFTNKKGESAEPYPISFKTGPAKAASATGPSTKASTAAVSASADDNRTAIDVLRRAVDEDYSYRDRLKVDWPVRFKEFGPKLESAASPEEFAKTAAQLLGAAKDIHISLSAGGRFFGTHQTGTTPNYNYKLMPRLLKELKQDGEVLSGTLEDNIGFIAIGEWNADKVKGLHRAYEALADCKGLVVDVRGNGGGDELLAREFAGVFIDAPKPYAKDTIHQNGRDEGPYDRVVEPNKNWKPYRKPVVVLMGKKCVSSNESFLLMMKQVPGCKLVGERSYGASGRPVAHDLGNGVTVRLPSWVDMRMDGTVLEGRGVDPDVIVKTSPQQLQERDAVLETAVKLVREGPSAKQHQ